MTDVILHVYFTIVIFQYCYSKRDIPSVNYVMHVNHCQRNITLCKHCQEPVPTSQQEEHFNENHIKVRMYRGGVRWARSVYQSRGGKDKKCIPG